MAVGSSNMAALHSVPGIRMSTAAAGIKYPGRQDVTLFEISEGSVVAGVYTLNAFCAAPVTVTKRHMQVSAPRYFLINTGNANAGTGTEGETNALNCCATLAENANVENSQVLPFSTGVIGEQLPKGKLITVLPELISTLSHEPWLAAARAIMTTDTRPKAVSQQLEINGSKVTITGIAKGSGMIKPNMATMLAYIFTDAMVDKMSLQKLLNAACNRSFNRITVDGDTSTNDCCMLVASGKSKVDINQASASDQLRFANVLDHVFVELAQGLIKDAEGAGKFVNVRVQSGGSSEECLQVAYTVAESPLVKTALFASDPNWGRVLAAVGRSGINELDINLVEIWLGDVCLVTNGSVSPDYEESKGQSVMNQDEIVITVKLGRGNVEEEVWTSDLSYEYVKINAEYRT